MATPGTGTTGTINRKKAIEALRERPGATVADLARLLRVDYKTAAYHARRLAEAGLVGLHDDGRRRRLFLLDDAPAPLPPPSRPPRWADALRALDAGARTPREVALRLAIPRGTAGSLLARLVVLGLVVRESASAWRATERARELLRDPGSAAA